LEKQYKSKAKFILVYIREAHPLDGWVKGKSSNINDPKTFAERVGAATKCTKAFKFEFTTVVDDMLDSTAVKYAAWPERLFVVGKSGKIIYSGGQGPRNFFPLTNARSVDKKGKDQSLQAFLKTLK
jgi:hypothetical protein